MPRHGMTSPLGGEQSSSEAPTGEAPTGEAPTGDATAARLDELLSIISHELRTPLTAIKGCARTLLRHGATLDRETSSQLLTDIDQEAERLHRLVENLLDLTRADAGTPGLRTEPTALDVLIRQVVADVASRVTTVQFRVHIPDRLPRVSVDPLRVEQVLRNLLDNAAKYSPPARNVDVSVLCTAGEVMVAVVDRGPGISLEHQQRIFERFYRIDPGADSVGGAGLGLAICRKLVELHGGRIGVDSEPGHGATFRFWLPLSDGSTL
ncbi:MAG: hypothetical protein IT305_05330 [Chloroflexi bacterium]|nr:hypothetical protein [Chloroflexota bacterium]